MCFLTSKGTYLASISLYSKFSRHETRFLSLLILWRFISGRLVSEDIMDGALESNK